MLEPGIRAFILGAALLVAAAAVGLILLSGSGFTALSLRLISAYGIVIIPGALGLMVLGIVCKIVPFLVWMRAYGPRVGRQPVPAAPTLASLPLERIWLSGHLIAIALIVIAEVSDSGRFAALGTGTLAAAAGAYLVNISRILMHLRPDGRPVCAPENP